MNIPGGRGHFFPGLGNRLVVLLEQVLAVIQQARVGEPWHRHQPSVHRGVIDLCLEVALGRVGGKRLAQIQQMFGQHPWPHHIDLNDVDVGGLRTEDLLVERQPLGRRVRRGNHLDVVAGLFRPRLDSLLAQL
ncbi:hypothetical protein D9M71_578100 [compost metagenome]